LEERKMSKIFNLLGLAVLGIVLLVGSAAAGDVEIGGCVIPVDYFHLNTTALTATVELGVLDTAETLTPDGGSLGVVAGAAYDLSVTSLPASGKMTSGALTLTNALHVVADLSDKGAVSDTPVELVDNGAANADCDDQVTAVDYSQQIVSGDYASGRGGNYAIELTYTVGAHT
jgi:hypothetical protein